MTGFKSALAALAALPLLAGCNTIAGMGEDVEALGRSVSGAADYMEREMFSPEPRATRTADVRVGQACDPDAGLAGGSGLPPCRSRVVRPTPQNH